MCYWLFTVCYPELFCIRLVKTPTSTVQAIINLPNYFSMNITKEAYDQQPLLIRQGALKLWGVPLASRSDFCRTRQLYSFNNFFAEACYDSTNGKLTCICSFTQSNRLDPYLDQLNLNEVDPSQSIR